MNLCIIYLNILVPILLASPKLAMNSRQISKQIGIQESSHVWRIEGSNYLLENKTPRSISSDVLGSHECHLYPQIVLAKSSSSENEAIKVPEEHKMLRVIIPEEDVCLICLDENNNDIHEWPAGCGHKYCNSCIQNFMADDGLCPKCNSNIQGDTLFNENKSRSKYGCGRFFWKWKKFVT
ncbi:hypothetical protein PGT21_014198 [Puccinia graminis f. sp. tritici]|uniref:RING-type domain-containing protein n=1 Tax=Puccinia graminis f. sp. tritici TaxID=56615 RepID=A0A5B0QNG7_PUCGR|nr:hypothetical protein PGT21_014198 [Puccinia graminis f. sp. tritici]